MPHAARSLLCRHVALGAIAPLIVAAAAFAQGSLTPPGAPAPTMKSLDQIEARTPVSAATTPGDATNSFIISQPGSYYLTGNLTGEAGKTGISITASNVTLDLNGFSLLNGTSNSPGIISSGVNGIVVRNGQIVGGWSIGIRLTSLNSAIVDVRSSNTTDEGIRVLGTGGVIERCQVSTAGGHGIAASTDTSTVRDCTVYGVSRSTTTTLFGIIGASVTNCTVNTVTNTSASGTGTVYGIFGATITDCRVFNVTGASGTAFMISGGVVSRCIVNNSASTTASALYGISAREVSHCHVYWLSPTTTSTQCVGIAAPMASDCVVERILSASGVSIYGIRGSTTDPSGETGHYTRNVVAGVAGTGIGVLGFAVVEDNRVSNCSTAIFATTGLVRGNLIHNNGTGISASYGTVIGNTSRGDVTPYSFGVDVRSGPIVTGGGVGGFDSTANLRY